MKQLSAAQIDSFLDLLEISAPATPDANLVRLYGKDKSGISHLYFKRDDGSEIEVGRLLDPVVLYQAYDDFDCGTNTSAQIGQLGWLSAGTGSSVAVQASEAGRVGLYRFTTGTTINQIVRCNPRSGSTTALLVPSDTFDFTFIFRMNQSDSNTQMRAGLLSDADGDPPANGIYLERLGTDTNWFFVTRASSTQTRTDSGVAASTSFVRFRVRRKDSSTISFAVNGGAETDHTANIPTAGLLPVCHMKTLASAAKSFDMDAYLALVTGLSR